MYIVKWAQRKIIPFEDKKYELINAIAKHEKTNDLDGPLFGFNFPQNHGKDLTKFFTIIS